MAVDPLSDAMSTTGDRMYTVLMLINVFMAWPQIPYNIVSYFQANLRFLPATLLLSKESILFAIIIDISSHWMRKNAEVLWFILSLFVLILCLGVLCVI